MTFLDQLKSILAKEKTGLSIIVSITNVFSRRLIEEDEFIIPDEIYMMSYLIWNRKYI